MTTRGGWCVAAVGLLLLAGGCSASGSDPQAALSSSAPDAPASTAPAVGATTLPAVGVATPAPFGDGLEATVTAVDEVQLAGEGPGEVAGPGTSVRITLRNDTAARVDLGGVVVGVTYGDGTPGDPSTSAPADVPTGVLEPGASTAGVWVFTRPGEDPESVEVSVGSQSSASVVVVRA